jgi:uncharacterized protein (TIGR03086 family)
MPTIELKDLHRNALAEASELVKAVTSTDLGRPTPCSEWNLHALLAHMVGQNLGIATALRDGDAPADAFNPRPLDAATLFAEWMHSGSVVSTAVAETDATQLVRLVELSSDLRLPAPTVAGMHLLDTVVHTWDIAASLGRTYRPEEHLLAAIAQGAAALPVDLIAAMPNPVFAAPLSVPDSDPWIVALARVGRLSTSSGAWNNEEISDGVAVHDR